jgi:hypothetical protein
VDNFLLSVWDAEPDFASNYYINSWSVEGDNDGTNFRVPFFEYWTGDGDSLGEKELTATIDGLEPGNYGVSVWARVRVKNNEYMEDAHGITFPSNEEAVKQLLVCLIGELAKSKDTERISLEFKKRNPHTGNFIVTGIGFKIPENKRENLFQAFAEVKDLTVDDGMKLPTCALMAYKLNGNLRLDEEFAQGTRFVVELHC